MPPTGKTKRRWLKSSLLRQSLWRKGREISLENFPPELRGTLKRRTAVALKAIHGFRPQWVEWGGEKKGGKVRLMFKPVLGHKSISRVDDGAEHNPQIEDFPADFMFGFKDWVGLTVRFMAKPSAAERARFRELSRLDTPSGRKIL
ncbi:MAG: hypothetical protein NTW59_01680 [Candidatus Diapherotrites archaeon]|nr:hypothetical protein [Candidatus Diapherotrites archaeon]